MPNLKTKMRSVPACYHHRPSGRAVVTIAGKDHDFGKYNSVESRAAYDRLIADWLAHGRPRSEPRASPKLSVAAVILGYWNHAKATYNRQTSRGTMVPALTRLRHLFGTTPAVEFGPQRLRTLQRAPVQERAKDEKRLSRRYVNRSIGEVERCFTWAVAAEFSAAVGSIMPFWPALIAGCSALLKRWRTPLPRWR